jgi:hypothetical protein
MIYAVGLWPSRRVHPHTVFVDNFVQKLVCHARQAAPDQRFDTLMTIEAEKFPMKSKYLDTNTGLSKGGGVRLPHAMQLWSFYMRRNVIVAGVNHD